MYKTISCVRRYFTTISLQRQGSSIKFHEGPNKGQIFKKAREPSRLDVRTYVGRNKFLIRFTKLATLDPRGPDFWPVGRSNLSDLHFCTINVYNVSKNLLRPYILKRTKIYFARGITVKKHIIENFQAKYNIKNFTARRGLDERSEASSFSKRRNSTNE